MTHPTALENKIATQLALIEQLMNVQQWAQASQTALAALDELGKAYAQPGVLDHTGTKLVAAVAMEREGRFEDAVRLRHAILQTRLALLRKKQAQAGQP